MQTSGSTGAPKPITLTRAQMTASARATGAALGLQPGMRSLVCLPARYIAGRMMLVRGLVLGLDMTVVEPAADPLADLYRAARFDFAAFVPLQLQTLLAGPPHYRAVLDEMQAILVGGAPVSTELEAALARLRAPVYHTYGMTETATHVALRRLNGAAGHGRVSAAAGRGTGAGRARLPVSARRRDGRELAPDERPRRSACGWDVLVAGAVGQRRQQRRRQGAGGAGGTCGRRIVPPRQRIPLWRGGAASWRAHRTSALGSV